MRFGAIIASAVRILSSFTARPSFKKGSQAYKSRDYALALRILRPLAEQEDARAQFILGNIYQTGQGVAVDDKEAVKWFRKAAEQGNFRAHFYLGVMYHAGCGVPQNYEQALKCFRAAAEHGDADAQSRLGDMYYEGSGVPQDYQEARKWWLIAAENGDDTPAQRNYQNSVGAIWLSSAQDNARLSLGEMYENGYGVPQNYREALKWYRAAGEADWFASASARFKVGLMYYEGRGVPQNFEEAVNWWQAAAKINNADAQLNLAKMYSDGRCVTQDYIEAYKWTILAAAQQNEEAQEMMETLANRMTREQIKKAQELGKVWTEQHHQQGKQR